MSGITQYATSVQMDQAYGHLDTLSDGDKVLLSMTGFGEAREQADKILCRVELRSVNNRHFKLALRCPDRFANLENEFERMLRETISRGSVSLVIRFERSANTNTPQINPAALSDYWHQLQRISQNLGTETPQLGSLITLPGVLDSGDFDDETVQKLWPVIERTVRAAAVHMGEFRKREGASMAIELQAQCSVIDAQVEHITSMAPQVIVEYRDKLLQRVSDLVKDLGSRLGPSDVLREVALFADRCDITEEITRLRSHLSQFRKLVDDQSSQGRKLDFMCQELFREVNTIGSKANHVGIAHSAVEAKVAIERMREIVQNVE